MKGIGMKYTMKQITPDVARAMLDANYDGNRRVSASHVASLARMMEEGTFVSHNGQTIVVGRDGTLYDGQHRLAAIEKSGVTLDMLVCELDGSDDEMVAFRSMDSGMKRVAASFIDGPYSSDKAALAKVAHAIRDGSAPLRTSLQGKMADSSTVTTTEAVDYFFDHRDEITSVNATARRIRDCVGKGPATGYGAFVVLARFVGRDVALDAFLDDLRATRHRSNATALFERKILSKYASKVRPDCTWTVANLLDAYEAFVTGKDVRVLRRGAIMLDRYDRMLAERRALPA